MDETKNVTEYQDILDYDGPIPIHAGFLCTANYLIRSVLRLDFKTPFMMMRISLRDIADIIRNDFGEYLNTLKYEKRKGCVYHDDYKHLCWNRLDPTEEKGYRELTNQVESYRRVIKANNSRGLDFICFAGFKHYDIVHPTFDMTNNVGEDALYLLSTAQELYPERNIRILIFSRFETVKDQIEKLGNPNIIFIFYLHSVYTWELEPLYQKVALKEMALRYGELINRNLFETTK